ncbi:transposase [Thermococcus piezophilus]|uniref:Transposase n=1 Tax=Thermococcus piezophilus TaxID=1712654 RepID=A0A172WF07_9EURY|nr:transposase [Thermococcus piezophilus]ANF21949.1 transposase [Thermococcus piezophilus]
MEVVRKLQGVYGLTLVLMMYLYPLTIVGLLLLRRVLEKLGREELGHAVRLSTVAFLLSMPLYVAKIFLGISGWAKVLGITPIETSPLVYNGVHVVFLFLQALSLYYIYKTLDVLAGMTEQTILRTAGLILILSIPMHFVSINVYFAATLTGLVLILFGLENAKDVVAW